MKFSPLTIAARNGHLSVIKVLLSSGIDIESRDSNNRTALYVAVVNNKPTVVQFLCEAKAEVNIYGFNKWTPLTAAAAQGFVEVINVLLKYGNKIDIEMRGGHDQYTPLYWGVSENHPEVVATLCKAKAKVNIYCGNKTPLTWAAEKGYTKVVKALSKYGDKIDLEMRDKHTSLTPLYYAASNGHSEIVAILCKAGADVNADHGKWGILKDAKSPEVIKILNDYIQERNQTKVK